MSRPKEEGGTLNLAVPLLVWIAVRTVRSLVLRVHLWGVYPNPGLFCTKKALLSPHTLLELTESSRADGP